MLTFVSAITSMLFKFAMTASHVKFMMDVITLKIPAIITHYQYTTMFHIARPWLMWRPF